MLALATGWTERTIGDGISDAFRRACHHALYARAVSADLAEAQTVAHQAEALDLTEIPTERRAAVRTIRAVATGRMADVRASLGLDEGDDG